MFDEDASLDDVRIEEGSRGRKRPIKAITRAREREIRQHRCFAGGPKLQGGNLSRGYPRVRAKRRS